MINLMKCLVLGHKLDWVEYDKRIETEQHYADGTLVYCTRCDTYRKQKNEPR